MIYHFVYQLNKKTFTKICTTLREAEVFFDILLAAKVDYIRVITSTRRKGHD